VRPFRVTTLVRGNEKKFLNLYARWLLDELLVEKKWDPLFAQSEEVLSNLADEALKEHLAGKTKVLNFGMFKSFSPINQGSDNKNQVRCAKEERCIPELNVNQ